MNKQQLIDKIISKLQEGPVDEFRAILAEKLEIWEDEFELWIFNASVIITEDMLKYDNYLIAIKSVLCGYISLNKDSDDHEAIDRMKSAYLILLG
jgi:hypothetical protein